MGKPNPPLLNYSKKNLKKVSNSIYRNLTEDLLPLKKYIPGNKKNAMYGHCHTASGCLYKIFGSKNVHLFRAMDKNHLYHWWVQDMNNNVIDLTQSQYSDSYVSKLYKMGEKKGLLGFGYKIKVDELLQRVRNDLGI